MPNADGAADESVSPQSGITPEQTRDVMASSKKLLKELPTEDAMRETLLGLLTASEAGPARDHNGRSA